MNLKKFYGCNLRKQMSETSFIPVNDEKKMNKYSQYALQVYSMTHYLDPLIKKQKQGLVRYIAKPFK